MTTKETKAQLAAAEARSQHRADLEDERKADEAVEHREDLVAARKVGASRNDPAPVVDVPPVKPVVAIAHFTAGEVEAIDAALRDSAKDRAVFILAGAIKRAMP